MEEDKIQKLKEKNQALKERNTVLTEKNRELREEIKKLKLKYKEDVKTVKAENALLRQISKKKVIKDGRVVKNKAGKWKQFKEDYPLLADSYYECVKKYGWVVYNHFHLAGYLRKLVEGDPKEGIPPQMSAERLARRYSFLASIPDNWWNGNIIFGPPPKTENKGQERINDLNNLMSTNPTVKSFWVKFSKEWTKKTESSESI